MTKKFKKMLKLMLTLPLSMFGICAIPGEAGDGVEGSSDANNAPTDTQNSGEPDAGVEKTFTQAEVNKMMKAEKESGRRSVLKELGVTDVKSTKEALEKFNAYLDSQKTDIQKANESVQNLTAQLAAEQSKNEQLAMSIQAITIGAKPDTVDELVAIASMKAQKSEKSVSDVLQEMMTEAAYTGFFAAKDTQQKGTGTLPAGGRAPSGNTEGSYGQKLANSIKSRQTPKENPYFKS